MTEKYHCYYCGLEVAKEDDTSQFMVELQPAIELFTIAMKEHRSIFICIICFKQNAPDNIVKELTE